MISSEIEKCIINYLTGNATAVELELLESWTQKEDNLNAFKEYIQMHHAINSNTLKVDVNSFKEKQLKAIQQSKKSTLKLRYLNTLKYAAILIIAMGSSYFFYQKTFDNTTDFSASVNQVTLQLENGTVEIISENNQKEILDVQGNVIGTQQNNKIVYHTKNTTEQVVYNTLTVPYGKQFELVLSDGTKVNLNSGSSIKYPVQFAANENREVSLNGEAYFDVAKNPENPFIVNANELKVRVLGTKFNLSAYPEESTISTVLVEGLVGLYDDNHYNSETATLITPGFKGSYNESDRTILKEKVDTRIYTSWINGQLIFRNIPFKNIIKKLERNYNVQITNNNTVLNEQFFNANFDAHEEISTILNTFQKSFDFNYTIHQNQISIN